MKKLLLLLTLSLLVLLNATAFAQDEERDLLELSFWGGMGVPSGDIKDFSDSLGAKSRYSIGGEIGYFFTPDIVVGFSVTYYDFGIDNNPNDTQAEGLTHRLYSPSIYGKYIVPTESDFSPYVKAHVGLDYAKFTTFVTNPAGDRYRQLSYDPSLSYGIGAGLFYFTNDYSGLFAEIDYHMASTSDATHSYEGNDYVFGANTAVLDLRIGLRLLFGSDE